MCSEFLRLTEVNAVDSLQGLLEKHGRAIVSVADNCGKALPALLNEHLEVMKATKSKETERGILLVLYTCFCLQLHAMGVLNDIMFMMFCITITSAALVHISTV